MCVLKSIRTEHIGMPLPHPINQLRRRSRQARRGKGAVRVRGRPLVASSAFDLDLIAKIQFGQRLPQIRFQGAGRRFGNLDAESHCSRLSCANLKPNLARVGAATNSVGQPRFRSSSSQQSRRAWRKAF